MAMSGELHCYSCGYVAARIVSDSDTLDGGRLVLPPSGPGVRRAGSRSLCCGRCGGSLYLDQVERVAKTALAVPTDLAEERGRHLARTRRSRVLVPTG